MQRYAFIFILAGFTLLFSGCGTKQSSETFLREDIDLDLVTRVAVLPFENYTKEQYIDERVRDVSITQVLALGIADVVDKGIVDSVMREEVIEPGKPIDLVNLKRLGQRLNVQAFLLGSVDEANEIRKGSLTFPELALTMRLVDASGSIVLWQASGRRSGETLMGRIFGIAPKDQFYVTLKLTKKLLSSIPSKR